MQSERHQARSASDRGARPEGWGALALLLLGAWLVVTTLAVRGGVLDRWWYHLLQTVPLLFVLVESFRARISPLATVHGVLLLGVALVHALNRAPIALEISHPPLMLAVVVVASRFRIGGALTIAAYIGLLDSLSHIFAPSIAVGWSAAFIAASWLAWRGRSGSSASDDGGARATAYARTRRHEPVSSLESAETVVARGAVVAANDVTRGEADAAELRGRTEDVDGDGRADASSYDSERRATDGPGGEAAFGSPGPELAGELLEWLRRQIGATSVSLYRLADAERFERMAAAEHVRFPLHQTVSSRAGLIATLWTSRVPLLQNHIERRSHQLAHHTAPEGIRHFAGIVLEADAGGRSALLLLADRASGAPFTDQVLVDLRRAGSVLLNLSQQQAQLDEARGAQETYLHYFRASSRLNEALTLEQVYDALEGVIGEVCPSASLAVVLSDDPAPRGSVVRANGVLRSLAAETIELEGNLLSVALKNRHPFPVDGRRPENDDTLLGRGRAIPEGERGILIVPLVAKHAVIGALLLTSPTAFGAALRDLFVGVANQAGVAIDNGRMYRAMEQLATHDGLTGLYNHRTFKARLAEVLARAERHKRTVTLLVADIDRFKAINDAHGHHNGDRVLRTVAALLRDVVRKTDVLARYGGEEFVALLEDTDEEGASLLAERMRKAIEGHTFSLDNGARLEATLSIGLASYPTNAMTGEALFKAADKALYDAKQRGRNRCVRFSTVVKRHAA
ncbi:MAG: GGDEF domain-containing protein [Myxococcales bacterium]|nr:GGDEF domain-containing protein [Myxococcales bacterium]